MNLEKILVIEDDEDIRTLLEHNLKKAGYQVLGSGQGEAGLKLAKAKLPDLVLLDLMLPGMDGFEVCKALKRDSKTERIPIIMLTAKGEETDVVAGLELGAEDYITKPFSPRVVVARIRTVLRRKKNAAAETPDLIKIHNLMLDLGKHEVRVAGKIVQLTITEFRLLQFLAGRVGFSPVIKLLMGSRETIIRSRNAQWMCRSSACARSWARPGNISRPCAG